LSNSEIARKFITKYTNIPPNAATNFILTVDRNNTNIRTSPRCQTLDHECHGHNSYETCGLVNLKPRKSGRKEAETVGDVQGGGLDAVGGGCEGEVPGIDDVVGGRSGR
jgi:hypothetical protein